MGGREKARKPVARVKPHSPGQLILRGGLVEWSEEQKRLVARFADDTQAPDTVFANIYGRRIMMGELQLVRGIVHDALHIFNRGVQQRIFASPRVRLWWWEGQPRFTMFFRRGRYWNEAYEWFLRAEPDVAYSLDWCLNTLGCLTSTRIDPGRLRGKIVGRLLEAMGVEGSGHTRH